MSDWPLCLLFKGTEVLTFNPEEVFFGEPVTVTCGPPPPSLNLGTNWTAAWTRDGQPIRQDNEHSFSKANGMAMLIVSRVFNTDNGEKNCRSVKVQSIDDSYSCIIYTLMQVLLRALLLVVWFVTAFNV